MADRDTELTAEERRLLALMEADKGTVAVPTAPTPTAPPEPDLAAALQRATYSSSAPDIGAVPAGTGVAVGPTGYATAGDVPQAALSNIPSPLAFRDNIAAPTPAQMAQAAEKKLDSDIADATANAARGDQASAAALKYLTQQKVQTAMQRMTQSGIPIGQALPLALFQTGQITGEQAAQNTRLAVPPVKPPVLPPEMRTMQSGTNSVPYLWNPNTGTSQFPPRQTATPTAKPAPAPVVSAVDKAAIVRLTQQAKSLQAKIDQQPGGSTPEQEEELHKINQQLDVIDKRYRAKPAAVTSATATTSSSAATGKKLTKEQAQAFVTQAGGDREKARQLARDAGYTF